MNDSRPIHYLEKNEKVVADSLTPIQMVIEKSVTFERGYFINERKNTARIPKYLLDTEIGLQIALANMETVDRKLGISEELGFSHQLGTMISKFRNAGIPLKVITDANGFNRAFDSAYVPPLAQPIHIETLELRRKDYMLN